MKNGMSKLGGRTEKTSRQKEYVFEGLMKIKLGMAGVEKGEVEDGVAEVGKVQLHSRVWEVIKRF